MAHMCGSPDDPCAGSIVASFIADPTTEPDSGCIAETVLFPVRAARGSMTQAIVAYGCKAIHNME